METLFILLPSLADAGSDPACFWWLAEGGAIVDQGRDGRWQRLAASEPDEPAPTLVALTPAAAVPVRRLAYPDLTPAQARKAAWLAVREGLLGAADTVHLVATLPEAPGGPVDVAAVSHGAMTGWRQWLADYGVAPAALVPLAALVPVPAPDQAIHTVLGDQPMLRTAAQAAASDPAIDTLLVGEAALVRLDEGAMLAALAQADWRAAPDLLTGAYAPQAPARFTADQRRWAARLAAAAALLALAISLVQMGRLYADTQGADRAALAAAAASGITAATPDAAEAAIDARLAARAGGPLAFSAPASGLLAAMRDVPGVALRELGHRGDGTLSATLAAPRVEDINAVLTAVQRKGFRITAQPMAGTDGMQMGVITVRAVP